MFAYKYKQPARVQVTHTEIDDEIMEVGRYWARQLAKVEPYGIIGINAFTKKLHVVLVLAKIARDDWKPALNEIIKIFGNLRLITPIRTLRLQGMN